MHLLFDIGGTHMRVGVLESEKDIRSDTVRILETPKDPALAVQLLQEIVMTSGVGQDIRSVSGGIAGVLDSRRTMLIHAPHLPAWEHVGFHALLSEAFHVSVSLENDAALEGLGEALYGAGKESEIMAYLTIGTGVGGARIVHRAIDEHTFGFEPGHQLIDFEKKQTLESCVSGSAFEKRFGKNPKEVGDVNAWDEAARVLAYGLHNVILHWSPDMVVLGGSMMNEIGIPLDRVEGYLAEILTVVPVPGVKKATLGQFSGIYGAFAYAEMNQKEK